MSAIRRATSLNRRFAALALVAAISALAVACSSTAGPAQTVSGTETALASPTATPEPVPTNTPAPSPTPTPEPTPGPALDTEIFEQLNPRPELREIDRSIDFGFDEREALPRDAINPIYSPKFATPEEVAELMIEDELVMGLELNGDARAYPVGIMRVREMVNDELGGVPLLVTW